MDVRLTSFESSGRDLIIGSCRDVTEQTKAEEALRRSADQLRIIIDTIPTLVWCNRPDGSSEFLNQRWLDYTGLSIEEARDWGWKAAIHPEDLPRLLDVWQALLASGKPGEFEARLRRLDGVYRWFLFRVEPLFDELGNIVKWYGTNTDIEDRKGAEALLAGENRVLEMIARGNPLPSLLDALCRLVEEISSGSLCSILLLDPNGSRLWHGSAPSLPASYTRAIDGSAIGPRTGPCGRAAYFRGPVIVSDIATDPLGAEYRDLALAHGLRACWSTPILSSDGKVLGTFAIYSNGPRGPTLQHDRITGQITHLAAVAIERKRTEAALQESEERFRQMADTIPEVIWITALDPEKVLYASPSFERIWGLPVEELYQNPRLWTEAIHPDDRERVSDIFTRWIAGGKVSYHDIEYRIVRPNGATRWIHERGVLSLNEKGKAYLVSGISTDITERKRAEEELRRSEAYLAEAQRLSLTGSFGWKVSSGELIWSDETFCILGYDRATKPALEFVLKRVHPEDTALVQRTLDSAIRDGTNLDFEHRLRMPDGTVKHVHVVAGAVREESGELEFVGAVMDVTFQKSSQQALERAFQEMEGLKNQFRLAVDTIPGLVWTCLPDGYVDFLNQRWREYTGLTLEEASGWGWQAAVHPDDLPRLVDYWRSVLGSGRLGETEARLRRYDGEYHWFSRS
jgi:PAS domain S-box-containing protein